MLDFHTTLKFDSFLIERQYLKFCDERTVNWSRQPITVLRKHVMKQR